MVQVFGLDRHEALIHTQMRAKMSFSYYVEVSAPATSTLSVNHYVYSVFPLPHSRLHMRENITAKWHENVVEG